MSEFKYTVLIDEHPQFYAAITTWCAKHNLIFWSDVDYDVLRTGISPYHQYKKIIKFKTKDNAVMFKLTWQSERV